MYRESKPQRSPHWGWGLSVCAVDTISHLAVTAVSLSNIRRPDCLCSDSISTWLSGRGKIPEILSASVSTCRQWPRLTVSIGYALGPYSIGAYPRPVIQDCDTIRGSDVNHHPVMVDSNPVHPRSQTMSQKVFLMSCNLSDILKVCFTFLINLS